MEGEGGSDPDQEGVPLQALTLTLTLTFSLSRFS